MNAAARAPRPVPRKALRICIAIDGSASGNRAAAFVVRLADALARPPRIDVVSVDEPLTMAAAVSMGNEASTRYHAENHAYYTRAALAKLRRADLDPQLHFYVDAEPAAALTRHLERHPADLLVAGSHGRSAFAAAVLGSVVTKLLSRTKVPMLVVR